MFNKQRIRLAALVLAILAVHTGFQSAHGQAMEQIHVPADYATIREAVDAAPNGAEIIIGSGTYHESITLVRPVTLRAKPMVDAMIYGTEDVATIQIRDTSGVSIEGLQIVGGRYGVDVFRSDEVTIRDNEISQSRLTGIRVRMASVYILGNTIENTQSPYGRGVHIANTMEWSESRIIDNVVTNNPLEGIVTNMTGMVTIQDNVVTDNGRRGIAITEMSHANVLNNDVDGNVGTGIHIMDESLAVVCHNLVDNTQLGESLPGLRYGNGVTIDYYSSATMVQNIVRNSPQHDIAILYGSDVTLYANDVSQAIFADNGQMREGSGCHRLTR